MVLTTIDVIGRDVKNIDAERASRQLSKQQGLDQKSMLCNFSIGRDFPDLIVKPTKRIYRTNNLDKAFTRLFKSKPQLAEPWVHAAFISFTNPVNKDQCRAAIVFYIWDTRQVLHAETINYEYWTSGDAIEYLAHLHHWQRAKDNGEPVLKYSEQLKLFE